MPTCFVIMPFGGYFDGYYREVIQPAVTSAGVSCTRADQIYGTRAIVDDIYGAIAKADICLADVTSRNPNVSYELGMAHALGKPVILVTQKIEDVPFDYRHLRIIQYEPQRFGWEKGFRESIAHTVNEILKNPHAHQALKGTLVSPEVISAEVMRQHIKSIFYAEAYDLDRVNKIYLDYDGQSLIKTSWKGTARSSVYHLCHNLVCDSPGPIEVRRAYDKLNARDLDYVISEQSTRHLTYFFLFKQFKEAGQPFAAETEVFAPGYINVEQFLESGEALLSTQAVANGIAYLRKEDWLHFPKNAKFAGVTAEYISHPRSELVGSKVRIDETAEHYLLKLVYEGQQPYQQETAARLRVQ